MKTKIIYISGNEVFDMTDIRAAFEEVRNTLGLGKDTVLFGVPVDKDNAFSAENVQNTEQAQSSTVAEPVLDIPEKTEVIPEPVSEPVPEILEEKPIKKAPVKKVRAREVKKEIVEEKAIVEDIPAVLNDTQEKVIPILSVLASKKNTSEEKINSVPEDVEVADDVIDTDLEEDVIETEAEEVFEEEDNSLQETETISEEPEAIVSSEEKEENNVTIEDMISDEAPDEPVEKTLEQLLESMTPLREDFMEEHQEFAEEAQPEYKETENTIDMSEEDSDATLEQLAAEFAENEDKIPTESKTENHSKIGKLKNILPFKKAKRDDNGLMGDLFGWAGIAANDEDFTIPGFFTNAASKK